MREAGRWTWGLVLLGFLVGCGQEKNTYAPPPAPEVTVAAPVVEDVTQYGYVTGRTEPYQTVEVRARVKGILKKILYEEGAIIEEGAPLFLIDPAPYEADLKLAEAEVSSAKAALGLAETTVQKYENLVKTQAVSELSVIEARAQRDVAAAAVQSAEAKEEKARLELGYTEVAAPIRGRVERWHVDAGGLVGSGEATLLTRIVNEDKIYAWASVAEVDVLKVREAEGRFDPPTPGNPGSILYLAMGHSDDFAFEGRVDYADPEIDAETGTLRVRSVFENPDRMLQGGMFVRIRFSLGTLESALRVPEVALGADQSGRFLLVVNSQNVVERRNVTAGRLHEGMRVIRDGIAASDRVIVNGLLRARPGAPVSPKSAP